MTSMDAACHGHGFGSRGCRCKTSSAIAPSSPPRILPCDSNSAGSTKRWYLELFNRAERLEFGFVPPGARCDGGAVPDLEPRLGPFRDSTQTDLELIFGSNLLRSIHYGRNCLQSFEHFKAV